MNILAKVGSIRDRALSITLIASVAAAMVMLGYTIGNPPSEPFTEFYILGSNGEAVDYPMELILGEEGRVKVGIINREQETVTYSVEVRIDGIRNSMIGPIEQEHDEEWEQIVSFTPDRVGDSQQLDFLLYKNNESEPYLELYLWIDVKE